VNKIFVDGCLTILKDRLEDDVVPMLVVYAVVGIIVALIEIIAVVLAAAFVAQVTIDRIFPCVRDPFCPIFCLKNRGVSYTQEYYYVLK